MAAPSLADWLRVVEPQLTPPLFDPRTIAALVPLAAKLPEDALAIFELRLADGATALDLSLRLTPQNAGAVAGQISTPHLRSFLSAYADPVGPFRSLPAVWVEFDLGLGRAELPEPIVAARLAEDADPAWIVAELLPAMHGGPLSAVQQATFLEGCRAAPPGARLLYAFSLGARRQDAIRLELAGLGAASIVPYLRHVAPRAAPLAAPLAPRFAGVERLHLSFDVGGEVLPRIGIEGSFSRLPQREPSWQELLERVGQPEDDGKRRAALAWSGQDTFWTAAARWPAAGTQGRGHCVRTLSHVKAVATPAGVETKVYLGLWRAAREGAKDRSGSLSSP